MKLAAFHDGGQLRLGLVDGDAIRLVDDASSVVEASAKAADAGPEIPLANIDLAAPVLPLRRNPFAG